MIIMVKVVLKVPDTDIPTVQIDFGNNGIHVVKPKTI